MPIRIQGEVVVWIEERTIHRPEEELTIDRSGWPVHEAAGFIGGIVKQVDTDFFCYHSGYRGVFFLRNFSGERYQQTQPGCFRGVLVGGIDTAFEAVEQGNFVPDPRLAVVHVQGQHGPAQHHTIFTATFPEGTADILDAVLEAFLQFPVFLDGFRGTDGHADLLAQFLPGDLPVLPFFIHGQFTKIKNQIMDEMKAEIEKITWTIFDSMIRKKQTFGRIEIDDSYDIAVYNTDGIEMTGSLSATEQMALAYAFTLAIHRASGQNCPHVIDSPLGRVSDDNRENMARALQEVSRDKQIIMLFTPDEYSAAVRKMYDATAEVRELSLSEDESYVEGIDG